MYDAILLDTKLANFMFFKISNLFNKISPKAPYLVSVGLGINTQAQLVTLSKNQFLVFAKKEDLGFSIHLLMSRSKEEGRNKNKTWPGILLASKLKVSKCGFGHTESQT